MKTIINTTKAPSPIGPYSQAVKANNTLYVSGQVALIPATGELNNADIGAETKQVMENLKINDIPHQDRFEGIIEKNFESEIWKEEAQRCVECGCCTIICPTCHCFLLYDQKNETSQARLRVWDSCMIKDYAQVAGGGNPRPKLWMRLRNRFEKKFDFFPKVAKVYACTGCGRCITGCPAKIDIRRVLRRLVNHV